MTGDPPRWVGRGALKLLGALDEFGLDPAGLRCLDAGASTGGFTDVLLDRGAACVVALDVGHGQLHERLRADQRVTVLERTNLRHVDPDDLGPFDAIVADLSFISLTVVMDVLVRLCQPSGWLVLLVKPQFEVGRREADRARGVIRDPQLWHDAVRTVLDVAGTQGAETVAVAVSPAPGAEGNLEFLAHLRPARGETPLSSATVRGVLVDAAVAQARELSAELAQSDRRGDVVAPGAT